MEIYRSGAMSWSKPPEDTFTGEVLISGYFRRGTPSRLAGAAVAFARGSRTPWKVNPLGQTLVVTSGVGLAQSEGEQVVEIRAGDLVWCPPGRRHWEGAAPDQAMTYVAMHEGTVEFMERVSDEEHQTGLCATSMKRRSQPEGPAKRTPCVPPPVAKHLARLLAIPGRFPVWQPQPDSPLSRRMPTMVIAALICV